MGFACIFFCLRFFGIGSFFIGRNFAAPLLSFPTCFLVVFLFGGMIRDVDSDIVGELVLDVGWGITWLLIYVEFVYVWYKVL